jgi:hypothetical protein
MGFYHVKSAPIVAEMEIYRKSQHAQNRAFNKVLKHYGETQGLLTNGDGLLAIKVKDTARYDMKEWCCFNKRKYGKNTIRPKHTPAGKVQREVFEKVKGLKCEKVLELMDYQMIFCKEDSRVLFSPGWGKFKGAWLMTVNDWAVPQFKVPDDVEEITFARFKELGGRMKG